jgi:hypothetical protein
VQAAEIAEETRTILFIESEDLSMRVATELMRDNILFFLPCIRTAEEVGVPGFF